MAAQAVRLHDLGNRGDVLRDARQFALAHDDGDERGERIAEAMRVDPAIEREKGTLGFEPRHARLHGVAREPECLGQSHHCPLRVLGEGGKESRVGAIQSLHNAQD